MTLFRESVIFRPNIAPGYADVFRPTLITYVSHCMHLAQKLLGPRNTSYDFIGIEFADDGVSPETYYPPLNNTGEARHIGIRLSGNAIANMKLATWQMAHEMVHVLGASGGGNANYLEEGLATHFQYLYINIVPELKELEPRIINTTHPHYMLSVDLVGQLFIEAGGIMQAFSGIKQMRADVTPQFCQLSARHIRAYFPGVSAEVTEKLASPFQSLPI